MFTFYNNENSISTNIQVISKTSIEDLYSLTDREMQQSMLPYLIALCFNLHSFSYLLIKTWRVSLMSVLQPMTKQATEQIHSPSQGLHVVWSGEKSWRKVMQVWGDDGKSTQEGLSMMGSKGASSCRAKVLSLQHHGAQAATDSTKYKTFLGCIWK